jgi:hypothetical protein
MRLIQFIAPVLCALLPVPVFAGAVPPQAMNKTITISFTATGQVRTPEGQVRNYNAQVWRIIYVSSAGRLFTRFRASSGRYSQGGDAIAGEGGRGSLSFQGDRLVGVMPFAAGARQITVTFDQSFSSCTLDVIEGHSGGVIRRRGLSGMMVEITQATTSTPSCSIRPGNAFAS